MFEGFLGNEELKSNVERLLDSGSLPHAVTICGRKGCGAGYFAKLLAAAYLGDRNGLVERGVHPDFLELSGEGPSGEIRIESVREDLYEISMASVMADGRRVIYIRHAGDLNESSANALLKERFNDKLSEYYKKIQFSTSDMYEGLDIREIRFEH